MILHDLHVASVASATAESGQAVLDELDAAGGASMTWPEFVDFFRQTGVGACMSLQWSLLGSLCFVLRPSMALKVLRLSWLSWLSVWNLDVGLRAAPRVQHSGRAQPIRAGRDKHGRIAWPSDGFMLSEFRKPWSSGSLAFKHLGASSPAVSCPVCGDNKKSLTWTK